MRKGAISVYLAVMLPVMAAILLSAFEAARSSAYRIMVECALKSAAMSAFGEYHRELYTEYGLLFIDTGYLTKEAGVINLEEHVAGWMEENLNAASGSGFFSDAELQVEVTDISYATEGDGRLIKEQITKIMWGKDMKADLTEDAFAEYLILNCGNYLRKKEGAGRRWETEYLCVGAETDRENLEEIQRRILEMRKMEAEKALQHAEESEGMTIEEIQMAAEEQAKEDLRILMAGGTVEEKGMSDAGDIPSEVLPASYEDHLRKLLDSVSAKERMERFITVVEENVQGTIHNEGFHLCSCAGKAAFKVRVRNVQGREYFIEREYMY